MAKTAETVSKFKVLGRHAESGVGSGQLFFIVLKKCLFFTPVQVMNTTLKKNMKVLKSITLFIIYYYIINIKCILYAPEMDSPVQGAIWFAGIFGLMTNNLFSAGLSQLSGVRGQP